MKIIPSENVPPCIFVPPQIDYLSVYLWLKRMLTGPLKAASSARETSLMSAIEWREEEEDLGKIFNFLTLPSLEQV